MVINGALSLQTDYVTILLKDSKSQRASKLHYWFKSYYDFAERVDFFYWWTFSGGGPAINKTTQSSTDPV